MPGEKDKKAIYLGSYGSESVTISGLSKEQSETIQGAVRAGNFWVRVVNGELEAVSAFEKLPDPIADEKMLPFWEVPFLSIEESKALVHKNIVLDKERLEHKYSSPSIYIEGLCGYSYSAEFYRQEARKLLSYGFECLRSRRENDGRYTEKWYLPLVCARGPLATAINKKEDDFEKLKAATEFLRHAVHFGSLDVSMQVLALTMD